MSDKKISGDISALQITLTEVESEIIKLTVLLRLLSGYMNEFHVFELKSIQK